MGVPAFYNVALVNGERVFLTMIIEIGHFALVLALFVAVLQGTIPLVGAHTGRAAWMALSVPAALAQFFLLGLSFAALSHAFITSDFSLLIVASNSHSLKAHT